MNTKTANSTNDGARYARPVPSERASRAVHRITSAASYRRTVSPGLLGGLGAPRRGDALPDRREEQLHRLLLPHTAIGAGGHRALADAGLARVHDDAAGDAALAQLGDDRRTGHHRHALVQDDDVRLERDRRGEGLAPVPRDPDDLEVVLVIQEVAEVLANGWVVVGHEDPDAARGRRDHRIRR